MSGATSVPARRLEDRTERAAAKLAVVAHLDCVHGGARALVLAKRLDRAGWQPPAGHSTADGIVGEVYATASLDNWPAWTAYQCRDCGTNHYGRGNAELCCMED